MMSHKDQAFEGRYDLQHAPQSGWPKLLVKDSLYSDSCFEVMEPDMNPTFNVVELGLMFLSFCAG